MEKKFTEAHKENNLISKISPYLKKIMNDKRYL